MSLGRGVRDGLLAGAAGGVAMSVATNTEMRVRGRPPSVVPVRAAERVLGLHLDEATETRLATVGHVISSAALGTLRGLMAALPGGASAHDAGFAVASFLPDFALIPATGEVPPPWRWGAVEVAVSALHHGVYAATTIVAYRRLAAG